MNKGVRNQQEGEHYRKPTDRDFWSWFAGFWEGEGSACFIRQHDRSRFSASQATRVPLDYIIAQTGIGYIFFRKPKRRKAVWWNDRGTYLWTVDKRRDVLQIARCVRPFLRFRGAQVDHFLSTTTARDAAASWSSWTANEVAILRAMFPRATRKQLQKKLNRTWQSIRGKATKLGLHREPQK